jgi:S1-C subfamily serine protease
MSIELRILSGSRAGQSELFEKSVIAVGRHPMSDLRFDVNHDIDVSTRHGEIRGIEDRYTVHDNNSTNGTFVNGERVPAGGSRELRNGDVIAFGAHGPTVSVRIANSRTTPVGDRATEVVPTPAIGVPAQAPVPQRRPTTERVAMAVAEQTRGLKIAVGAAIVVFGGLGAGLYWMGHSEARESQAKLQSMMAAYEQSSKDLQARVASTNDTTLIHSLERQRDSLVRAAKRVSGSDAAVMQQAIQRQQDAARAIGEMDPSALAAANNPGLTFVRTDIGTESYEASGFNTAPNGLVVTNRHVVENANGKATKVLVKFADTPTWLRAHVVRVPPDASVDLALLQIDDAGTYPVVRGVASSVDVPVGKAIISLGFPLGTDLPMAGARATTTLTLGTVSKSVPDLLQIDSYASHGSSGSPVLDGHGHVIGVIYGGPREAAGRIVYAVPAPQIFALIGK